VAAALHDLLLSYPERPFVRRVRESWRTLRQVPGARIKRLVLNRRGRNQGRFLERDGFPGCDWLAGITDPHCTADPEFFSRWLTAVPGQSVELMCHPGYLDLTLIGRDCMDADDGLRRRVNEFHLLKQPGFLDVVREAGFEIVPASWFGQSAALAA
jgi:hypothetical protein